MPAAGIVTLVGVALTVAALAIYLITIAAILSHVTRQLDRIIAVIQGISAKAAPLSGVMGQVTSDLDQVHSAVSGLASRARGAMVGSSSRR